MTNKRIISVFLYAIGFFLLIIIAINIISYFSFRYQIRKLYNCDLSATDQKFYYHQIDSLPYPVKRYFKHVMKDKQPYINYITLYHNGNFKPNLDKDWISIKGEQYFTTQNPGFIWKGRTAFFNANDMYFDGKGSLEIYILSIIKIQSGQGDCYDQGELMRWLAESVWFPTNLLPSKRINWLPVDSLHAKLKFEFNQIKFEYLVTFNNLGELIKMETARYYDGKSLKPWICKFSKYKSVNNILIPIENEAMWIIDGVEKSYAKFNINFIDYNKPKYY